MFSKNAFLLSSSIGTHQATRVMSLVIGVLKLNLTPASCHSTNSKPAFSGSVGLVTLVPSSTVIGSIVVPPSLSKVLIAVLKSKSVSSNCQETN